MPRQWGLSLFDLASFDHFGRDPKALDLSAGEANADPLQIWPKGALGVFDHVGSDTATLFGLTFTSDATTGDGALTRNNTNS